MERKSPFKGIKKFADQHSMFIMHTPIDIDANMYNGFSVVFNFSNLYVAIAKIE